MSLTQKMAPTQIEKITTFTRTIAFLSIHSYCTTFKDVRETGPRDAQSYKIQTTSEILSNAINILFYAQNFY